MPNPYSTDQLPEKAAANDFPGRFREIIADPINLLIERHPMAGTVKDGFVVLHNGHRVPLRGKGSYYEEFSDILIYNRGVHEPLEEWAFQEVLKLMPQAPVMLELGAYWGHYSMWMQQVRPQSVVHLVEPDKDNLETGKANFARHGYQGTFHQALVGTGHFTVDQWMQDHGISHLDILHSDIQGFELEMLEGACNTITDGIVDYLFVSTHSRSLHTRCSDLLTSSGCRIEITSEPDEHTTSCDGYLLATRATSPRRYNGLLPQGRKQINMLPASSILEHLAEIRWAWDKPITSNGKQKTDTA